MGNLRYDMKQNCMSAPFENGAGKQIQDKDTIRTYRRSINHFCDWAKEKYQVNNSHQMEAAGGAAKLVQEYEKDLETAGKSANTIHTYLSPICKGLKLHLNEIKKPKRTASNITKSRDVAHNKQGKAEAVDKKYERLVEFQKLTGIRRSEIGRLKVNSFAKDESGHLCVVVERGKGGKMQMQRILPADVPRMRKFVRSVLDAIASSDVPREKISLFTKSEMNNKIDLHGMRAEHAREAYRHYLERCQTADGKEKLQDELVDRWNARHGNGDRIEKTEEGYHAVSAAGKRFIDEFSHPGKYQLRGANKERCMKQGRPIAYDRTALLAVSVFHLSHWRNDVTVKHYML